MALLGTNSLRFLQPVASHLPHCGDLVCADPREEVFEVIRTDATTKPEIRGFPEERESHHALLNR